MKSHTKNHGRGFEPHGSHCVVVLEQDAFHPDVIKLVFKNDLEFNVNVVKKGSPFCLFIEIRHFYRFNIV